MLVDFAGCSTLTGDEIWILSNGEAREVASQVVDDAEFCVNEGGYSLLTTPWSLSLTCR